MKISLHQGTFLVVILRGGGSNLSDFSVIQDVFCNEFQVFFFCFCFLSLFHWWVGLTLFWLIVSCITHNAIQRSNEWCQWDLSCIPAWHLVRNIIITRCMHLNITTMSWLLFLVVVFLPPSPQGRGHINSAIPAADSKISVAVLQVNYSDQL